MVRFFGFFTAGNRKKRWVGDTDRSKKQVPGGFWTQKSQLFRIPVRSDFGVPRVKFGRFGQDPDNFTAGNSFCGWFGVVRDKKRPQPRRIVYPAVNFDQDYGRGPNLGVPGVQNGRFGQD